MKLKLSNSYKKLCLQYISVDTIAENNNSKLTDIELQIFNIASHFRHICLKQILLKYIMVLLAGAKRAARQTQWPLIIAVFLVSLSLSPNLSFSWGEGSLYVYRVLLLLLFCCLSNHKTTTSSQARKLKLGMQSYINPTRRYVKTKIGVTLKPQAKQGKIVKLQ